MEKQIYSFIRLNDSGSVEKVTWTKRTDGSKYSSVEPYNPELSELQAMARNQYFELRIN